MKEERPAMKPFLEELAVKVASGDHKIEELVLVFPNRRAALFFEQHLSKVLKVPSWSPVLMTVEELFRKLSTLQEADKLGLIFKLHTVYQQVMKQEESFDRFYFWGEMLLRDFDEVDKYMVPAELLFKDLTHFRELDDRFDYLSEEQRKFLEDFWVNIREKPAGSKEEFLRVWRELPTVYSEFVNSLRHDGLAYEGMIHREVADRLSKNPDTPLLPGHFVFAGFNALTKAEELVISHFVRHGAEVHWDVDEYYVSDKAQESGRFFRQYQNHKDLGKTFAPVLPSNFKTEGRKINLYGVPQKVGQAKLLGQLLEQISQADGMNSPLESRTVIVLPDESLLLPVMHSLPATIEKLNVTMGYPLRNTPLYNLLELLIDLQLHRKEDYFSHRQVTAILSHAYVVSSAKEEAVRLRMDILHHNRIYIKAEGLQKEGLLSIVFQVKSELEIASYLLDVVQLLGASFEDDQRFDGEYAFHFHRQLSRLRDLLRGSASHPDMRGFQKLFRLLVQSQKIPFTGEPLNGLQIMGVLETRNLDFENVFILSLNEGMLPAAPRQGSYIPHAIRKAYSLPTVEHQDAMYAYLFQRILQRATNVSLFYNTEPDILGMGEMSRFVLQLMYESGIPIKHHILNNPVDLKEEVPIRVAKTPRAMEYLSRFVRSEEKGISPSALNDYIECSLRFYLKHIAGLREPIQVSEEFDNRIFGNLLHSIMDWFYQAGVAQSKDKIITAEWLAEARVNKQLEELVERAFRENFHLPEGRPVDYSGQWVVVKAILLKLAQCIIGWDRDYAPFRIEMLEEKNFGWQVPVELGEEVLPIRLSGRMDRVDSKDGFVRVIDYKTGRDDSGFDSISSLFAREGKRNKAAFQTILYAWIYQKQNGQSGAIKPMLMSRGNLFGDDLKGLFLSKVEVTDVRPLLKEFEENMKTILEELYNPEVLFSQTAELNNCSVCAYHHLCRRPSTL